MSRPNDRRRFNTTQSRLETRRRAVRAAVGCAVESLEGRQLFSTLTVSTTADNTASDGQLSLREAIALIQNNGDANAALGRTLDVGELAQVDASSEAFGVNDRIYFDISLAGGTITLGSTINVSGTFVIDGGDDGMTLSGGVSQATWRAFYVTSTGDLTLNKLTITNFSNRGAYGNFSAGGDGHGGAIFVDQGTLALINSTLSNNSATGGDGDLGPGGAGRGGAIYVSQGSVTLTNSTLSNNSVRGGYGDLSWGGGAGLGGALYVDQGTLIVTGGTLLNNSATGGTDYDYATGEGRGGAIYNAQGTLTVSGAVTLQGNTASNGNAAGGAIYSDQGTFTLNITGGTVSGNAAHGGDADSTAGSGYGGAIYSAGPDASLTFANTSVANNSATGGDVGLGSSPGVGAGGFVYLNQGALSISGGSLDHNSATGGDSDHATAGTGSGGAIYNDSGTLTLTGATLSYNSATGGAQSDARGGAIYNVGAAAAVTVTASTVDHNSANGGGNFGLGSNVGSGVGGFLYNDSGSVTITTSTLSSNSATGANNYDGNGGGGYGGAIFDTEGNLSIEDSTLVGNSATGGHDYGFGGTGGSGLGGAIYVNGSLFYLHNATLVSNSAAGGSGDPEYGGGNGLGRGGAIYAQDGITSVQYSTLSSNTAAQGGRGLFVSGTANLDVYNSILGQADASVTDVEFSGSVHLSTANNLIRNTSETGLNVLSSADPKLGPLQDNGGPTWTMRPATNSPAIDAADYSIVNAFDQRGIARAPGAYDIGAVELANATLTVNSSVDEDARDSYLTLREAFRLISGTLAYGDLTVDEQALIGGTLGDIYFIEFDSSLTGATFYLYQDDGDHVDAPTAFMVSKTVTVTGLDDGDQMTFVNDSGGALRLFYVTGTGDLTLRNLSVRDFTAAGADDGFAGENARGGAIYIDGGTVTIENCEFANNSAIGGDGGSYGGHAAGGAIYNAYGTLTIDESMFRGNFAKGGEGGNNAGGNARGGAIYNEGGAVSLGFVTFVENEALGGAAEYDAGGAYGGAIYTDGGDVNALYLAVFGGHATGGDSASGIGGEALGGAIFVAGGTFTGTLVVLAENQASGGSGDGDGGRARGGAMFVGDGTVSLTTFGMINNVALGGVAHSGRGGDALGGALAIEGGVITLTAGQITDNTAAGGESVFEDGGDGLGGAVGLMGGGALTLVNATVAQNSAVAGIGDRFDGGSYGGAVYANNGDLTINFSTISGNHADAVRGVFFSIDSGSHQAAIDNSILGEAGDDGTDLWVVQWGGSLIKSGSNNLIRVLDATGIGNVSDADPRLAPLGNYGGSFFQTIALLPDSPALDAGSSAGSLGEDGRGADRVFNGTPDIGAFESQGYTLTVGSGSTPQSTTAGGAFDNALSVTLTENFDDAPIPGATVSFVVDSSGSQSATFSATATTNSSGVASVTATANAHAGSYTVTASVGDGGPQAETADFSLTNTAVAPSITSTNGVTFTTGMTGMFTVTTTGTPTVALSATGTLPGGVTFVDNGDGTATLSGMLGALAGGTYTLTITAANDGSPDATQTFTITVNQAPAITSANGGTFTAGSAGTFTVTTTGFPTAALTKSGTLPTGLTFTDNGNGTATLSGTPTGLTGGTYTLTLSASNGVGSTATQTFTLTVNQAPAITSANHATLTAGSAGTFTVATTGFPVAALTKSGSLPAGISFVDNGNGTATLSGTPAAGTAGVYTLTLSAGNGIGSAATQTFTLTVNAPVSSVTGTAPTITSPATLTLVAGQAGTFTVTTTGSPIPALHVTGTLPAGVTFVDNGDGTGTFSGTAAAVGNYAVSVVADNGVGEPVTQSLAITVNAARPIIVASGYTGGRISVTNPDGTNRFTIKSPFKKNIGVRLASADVNGDGVADIIVAAGVSGQPQVLVYDGLTGEKLTSFMAFNKSFTGGVFVAAADVNRDGTPDIVVGQGIGGTSKVRVFSGKDSSLLADFNPFGNNAGGARVATADVNGDGFAEVIAAQGFGGGNAMVKVYDGRTLAKQAKAQTLSAFSQAQLGFAGGAFVATGDVNGDGTPDILVSQSTGSKPFVTVIDGRKAAKNALKSAVISSFRVASDDGVRITSNDVNHDGFDDIVTSVTLKGKSLVKIFSGADGSLLDTIESDGAGKGFVA